MLAVAALRAGGMSRRAISRRLGIGNGTVERIARAMAGGGQAQAPDYKKGGETETSATSATIKKGSA